MAQFDGGCLCGQVRYSCTAEPVFTGVCHCRDCQHFTGSAFSVVVAVPRDAVRVSGTLSRFTSRGESGKEIHRSFCPTCGSSVMDEAAAMPGVVMFQVGTLDDSSGVQPAMHIYCDSAQPWVEFPAGAKKFPRMPMQ